MAMRTCHILSRPSFAPINLTRLPSPTRKFSLLCCIANPSDTRKNQKLVLEVKERLERDYNSLPLGRNGRDDEEMIMWFLKDRRFSVDEAKWRKDLGVDELSEESLQPVAKTGKGFVHDSFDVYGRPVLVVVACKHFPNVFEPVEDEKLCAYLIEKALSKLPAGVDQILGVVDLRGFGTRNADLKFLTFLFDLFYNYYPKRLGELLFVDAPFVFQPIWQVAKPMMRSYASLVKFCSADTVRKEYFTEETLPENFRD